MSFQIQSGGSGLQKESGGSDLDRKYLQLFKSELRDQSEDHGKRNIKDRFKRDCEGRTKSKESKKRQKYRILI